MQERGRPKIQFTDSHWEQLDKLCEMQCTREEAAAYFDISIDTMDERVKEQYGCTYYIYQQSKVLKGRTSLRRMQWQSAQKGNVQMQIWLGKQYLSQSDKVEQKNEVITLADLITEREVKPHNVEITYDEPHRADQPRPIELKPLTEEQQKDDSLKDYQPGSALDQFLNSDAFKPQTTWGQYHKEIKDEDEIDE